MLEEYEGVENATKIHCYYKPLACVSKNTKLNEINTLFTDANFFTLFEFHLYSGNSETCLNNPGSIVLSESAAKKYFGKLDVLGEQIIVGNRFSLTVTGIYKDFPANSNFQ